MSNYMTILFMMLRNGNNLRRPRIIKESYFSGLTVLLKNKIFQKT